MSRKPGHFTADFSNLEYLHETKRKETLKALECLADAKFYAFTQLRKIQVLFKYLNWKQQEFINSRFDGQYSLEKICTVSSDDSEFAVRLAPLIPENPAAYSTQIQRVKALRKNILQFGIIQARAAELIEAIARSAAVFNHQYKTSCRELFPLGFISRLWRSAKRFFNRSYFSWQDMGRLQNLGLAAGFVLKIAETPILGGRR